MSGAQNDETTPDAAARAAAEGSGAQAGAGESGLDLDGTRRAGGEEMARAEEDAAAFGPPGVTSPPVEPASAAQPAASTPPNAEPASAAQPAASTPPIVRPGPGPGPVIEPPTADVAPVGNESTLPGTHRGGYERWPTAPVGITPTATAPDLDAPLQWAPAEPSAPSRGLAAWALVFAIIALVVSTFVGWGFPIGFVAIITAIVALRRPLESRAVAVWALVLGVVSVLYSAGWLWFAATQMNLLG